MKWISRIFLDGTSEPSWYRVFASIVVLASTFTLVWSVITQYESGVLYSSGIITAIMGLKVLQKGHEIKKE